MTEEKKAKMKKIGESVAVLLLTAYTIFAISMFSNKDEYTTCKGVVIDIKDSTDKQFLTKGDIMRYLNEEDQLPTGKEMKDINTTKLEREMQKRMSSIKRIDCYKTPDEQIYIKVTQRTPVVRVMTGTETYYIDEDNKRMPSTAYHPAYVLIATGRISEKMATGELFEFANYISKDKFWNAQIEQIDFDYHENVTLIPRIGLHQINFGKLDDYEKKLDKLKKLYVKAFNKDGWNKYKEINLKYDNQVVCTKK